MTTNDPAPPGSPAGPCPRQLGNGDATQRSAAQIQQWFVHYLSGQLAIDPDQIDVTVPFENLALDSATAIGMTGDLEQWLGKSIDPTLVYDYPTIEAMSRHLAE